MVGQVAGILPIGLLALATLLAKRDRLSWALALCAATGSSLILFSSYGQEGLLRVVLFALPWLAILAASMARARHRVTAFGTLIIIPVVAVGYLFATMGLDYYYSVRPGDIAVVRYFEDNAPKCSLLFEIGNGYLPTEITARYWEFHTYGISQLYYFGGKHPFDPKRAVTSFTRYLVGSENDQVSYYAITGEQPKDQMVSVGQTTEVQYEHFEQALARSKHWHVIYHSRESTLYKLTQK